MASPRATGRQQAPLSDPAAVERHKGAAARAAAELVADGMRVGLGTGSTVAYLLHELALRELAGVRFAATSPETERVARALGMDVAPLDELGELDLAIDGADQIDPEGWLIKGAGAAHTREKIVAAAAKRFVVIASAEKLVEQLGPPVPLELMQFGVQSTLRALGQTRLRTRGPQERLIESPDGGLIADYLGPVEDPRELAARLSATPGMVAHGLFAPELVSTIVIAGASGIERRAGAGESEPPTRR